jgi:alkylation response protein AidB-like acyl-CoA dehydrogenase
MTTEPAAGPGGGFLFAEKDGDPQLIPEALGPEARAIAQVVDEFYARDVVPALPALDRHDYLAARRLLQQAGRLGLTATQIPERFGGLAVDLPTVMLAVEHLADDPSYQGWHLGHGGLGTLPLVYFGSDELRARYLPRLASADLVAAFALTEPHAGSDAFAARTRADLTPDGRAWILNGQKAWITNGGAADLFTVFAKAAGAALTAFVVERTAGVRSGAEERKMGLAGTSTTALFLDDVRVPVENVIGDVGRGHAVALTVLNCGRLEMGPIAVRGAKRVLRASLDYARTRHAAGGPIGALGAVQEKLATISVRLFAAESAAWRAIGLVSNEAARRIDLAPEQAEAAAFRAHAVECAIVKVHASEMLDYVADEGVQIHGGYGCHRDYLVERAYRDARVNRIFEGTNEINRLTIARLLAKRLPPKIRPGLFSEDDPIDPAARARRLTLEMFTLARERLSDELANAQEVSMRLADLAIETFALSATAERARQLAARGDSAAPLHAPLYWHDVAPRLRQWAREVIEAVSSGDQADDARRLADDLTREDPIDAIALRRQVASAWISPALGQS